MNLRRTYIITSDELSLGLNFIKHFVVAGLKFAVHQSNVYLWVSWMWFGLGTGTGAAPGGQRRQRRIPACMMTTSPWWPPESSFLTYICTLRLYGVRWMFVFQLTYVLMRIIIDLKFGHISQSNRKFATNKTFNFSF